MVLKTTSLSSQFQRKNQFRKYAMSQKILTKIYQNLYRQTKPSCVAYYMCCKLHVLQIAHVAKLHMFQKCTSCKIAHVAKLQVLQNCRCYKNEYVRKLRVLQNGICCKLHVFQIAHVAYCTCCKLPVLQIALISTLGLTWEFKLCLKSCKLASWTTTWLKNVRETSHPPLS